MKVIDVFSLLYARLISNEAIQFSITREGLRCQSELSYSYEGMIMRMMYLLEIAYNWVHKEYKKDVWRLNKD